MLDIKENIILAPFTTLKIGGPARFFVEALNEDEIFGAVKFAKDKKLSIFVLGGGSNLLVSDKGFDGLVIRINNAAWTSEVQMGKIECGAGVLLSKVVSESVKAGLTGLEWAAGIPGTVGGAVRGNAGAFGGEMADIIQNVDVLEIFNFQFPISNKIQNPKIQNALRVKRYELSDCKFSYRSSIFKENPNLIILSTALNLQKGDKEESTQKIKEIMAARKEVQSFGFPSSGSFFKNPMVKKENIIQEYEKDTGNIAKDNIIPAGYLIDSLNLRGKTIGGAMVSQEHGNFLVNTGNATAEDFIILMSLIKQKVRVHFGAQLQEEVQLVGF